MVRRRIIKKRRNGGGLAQPGGPSAISPSVSAAPVISGSAQPGQVLSCSTGTWAGSNPITFTRQWKRNGANISGATAQDYTAQSIDVGTEITCTVTATNMAGTASATSAGVTVTNAPQLPINTAAPSISGSLAIGGVLTVSNGTWTGTAPITYGYQWKRAGSNISGATAQSYTTQVADDGQAITCTVTATNTVGSANVTSAAITPGNPTSVSSQVTGADTVVITLPYSLNPVTWTHAREIWLTNRGFIVTVDGHIDCRVINCVASGSTLTLTLNTYMLPGAQVAISFTTDSYTGYPFSTSPRQAGGAAIPPFSTTATRPGTWSGAVRYVSATASGTGNGLSASTPWNAAQANANISGLPAGTLLLFRRGETYNNQSYDFTNKQDITIAYYGTGASPRLIGDSSKATFHCRYHRNISIIGLRIEHNKENGWEGIRFYSDNAGGTFGTSEVYSCYVTRCFNGIYARYGMEDGAQIIIMGCKTDDHDRSGVYYEGWSFKPVHDTYTLWCEISSIGQNKEDGSSLHAFANSASTPKASWRNLGLNHFFRGCWFHGASSPIEGNFDNTASEQFEMSNCWFLSEVPGNTTVANFIETGWGSSNHVYQGIVFEARPGCFRVNNAFQLRIQDIVVRNCYFSGTYYSFFANTRGGAILVYTGDAPEDYAGNWRIDGNTFDITPISGAAANAQTAPITIWQLPAPRTLLRAGKIKNNRFHYRTSGGVSFLDFQDSQNNFDWSTIEANGNRYSAPDTPAVLRNGGTLVNMAAWRTGIYSKEAAGAQQSNASGFVDSGDAYYKARVITAQAGTGVVSADLERDITNEIRSGAIVPGCWQVTV